MVPGIALFERNIRPLVYMFRFAFGVKIDRNLLMHSENSAKCWKRNQKMSLSLT